MLVAGVDDSVMVLNGARRDISSVLADLFNLECKLLTKYDVPYFCSKFLVEVNGWVHVVPDPLKVVTKFGRLDMSNYKHVEEYRISCMDTLAPLFDLAVAEKLTVGIRERYGSVISDTVKLINVLYTVVHDDSLFASLYIRERTMTLCNEHKAVIEFVRRKRALVIYAQPGAGKTALYDWIENKGIKVADTDFFSEESWDECEVLLTNRHELLADFRRKFARVVVCFYERDEWNRRCMFKLGARFRSCMYDEMLTSVMNHNYIVWPMCGDIIHTFKRRE